MRRTLFFFLILSSHAWAAVCPSGHMAITDSDGISLGATCDNGISLGTISPDCSNGTICAPHLKCNIGITSVRIGNGARIQLFANQHTTPALHVATDNGTCYANLTTGNGGGAINIQMGGATYHTTGLLRCFGTNAAATATAETPATNSVNWNARSGPVSISGISHCGSLSGTIGKTAGAVTTANPSTQNTHCWCRMIIPATSAWTFGATHTNASTCSATCAQTCAKNFTENATFRGALFNNFLP